VANMTQRREIRTEKAGHLEDLDIDGKVILKQILNKLGVGTAIM
jgi:hypothetical protein